MTDYEKLIASINARSNPENLEFEKAFKNEILEIKYGNVEKYIRLAMHGVDQAYTSRIREAGDKVKGHLKAVLNEVTYKYQGSVETNTHIVATSDIDLLVITDKFWTPDYTEIKSILESLVKRREFTQEKIQLLESIASPPFYNGNANQDLRLNRFYSEKKLLSVYNNCTIDKPKAIQITNQSLKKEVDVVIAGWFDSTKSIVHNQETDYRGIQIYNKKLNVREGADFPFLKIKLLNERSTITNGRLKKMIRFLKNIKANLNDGEIEQITQLKSFQFNAICFDIVLDKYKNKNIFELVAVVYVQLKSLYKNDVHRNNLMAVDDSENIFKDLSNATIELKLLMDSIFPIIADLHKQRIV
jgi:hypothetical protein